MPPKQRRKQPLGQTIGGVLFGFEQQVLRSTPPPEELVHHARPDDPVPAGDGTMLSISLPHDDAASPTATRRSALEQIELRELAPQTAAAVRVVVPWAELDMSALFDRHLPAIAARLDELGARWAGAPYGRYHEWGTDRVDVEMGIPVEGPVAGLPALGAIAPGEIGLSGLPGGRAAVAAHRGSYGDLAATWDRLRAWLRARNLEAGPGPWESYVDAPVESAMDDVRTEIVQPLA